MKSVTSQRCRDNENVSKFRKLGATLHSYISKMLSCTKEVAGRLPSLLPSAMRCNAQIGRGPKGQGCSSRAASVPPKTLKWGFSWKMTPFRKNFEIIFQQFLWRHRFTFCVQISRKSSPWQVGETMRCFLTKSSQNAGFSAPFCARSAKDAKSLQRGVPHDPMSPCCPCKISSQSVPICRIYSRKSDFV